MKNIYEYLRRDTQNILGDAWNNYPTTSNYQAVEVYRNEKEYIILQPGQQDGFWVIGITCNIGKSYHGFAPGRKWGQFSSRGDAVLWGLAELLIYDGIHKSARNAVVAAIENIRQLTLF